MQAAVWQLTAGGASAAHDLCISAPTGSGKTLAYALPIMAALQRYAATMVRRPSQHIVAKCHPVHTRASKWVGQVSEG